MTSLQLNLATGTQWTIFLAIILIFWGYIENKQKSKVLGLSFLAFTGVMGLVSIFMLKTPEIGATPDQIEANNRLFMLSIWASLTGITAFISIFLLLKESKIYNITLIGTVISSLLLFFQLYNFMHGIA